MNQAISITAPLLNPNEPEALLSAIHVTEGQYVLKGQPLFTLETTKATAEVTADADGYVVGLRYQAGQVIPAGETLAYLSDDPHFQLAPREEASPPAGEKSPLPQGLRITQPALALAQKHGVALDKLPVGPLITESLLRAYLESPGEPDLVHPRADFDPTAIVVYGGGGHGKALIDLLRSLGTYRIVGIIDDGIPRGQSVLGLEVLGGAEALADLHAQGVRLAVNAVGGIGDIRVRIRVFQRLAEAGFACPALAHPTAWIEPSASLSPGVQVLPHAYVGSEARLGFGTMINTGAIVSHDCVLGDYTIVSPGAILAGGVKVEQAVLIGMGATINLEVHIGAGARIGNGATVKDDVPANGVVRAGSIWPE